MGKKIPKGVNEASDIADFLFATKSIERIAKGAGSWGDLIDVGITAASFFIPPLRLAKLPAGALTRVITSAEKVVSSDVASVVAKRVAAKTMDDALTIKRQGYVPDQPKQSFSGEFDAPVERVGKSVPFEPEGKLTDKYNPKLADKKYTRPMDEDLDPFNRDRDLLQEADDALAMSGGKKQRLTKEEFEQQSKEKLAEGQQFYDKRKFTEDQIQEKINNLTQQERTMLRGKSEEEIRDYVRGAEYEYVQVYKTTEVPTVQEFVRGARNKEITELIVRKVRSGEYTDEELDVMFKALPKVTKSITDDEDKVISIYENMQTLLKMERSNPGLLGKGQKEILEFESRKLKKEYKKIQLNRQKNERIIKELDEEMPPEIQKAKPEAKLIVKDNVEDAQGGFYDDKESLLFEKVPENADVPTQLKPGTGTSYYKKVPDPEVVAIKVPIRAKMDNDLREGLGMPAQKFAELQAEIERLTSFNKANSSKLRYASKDEAQELKVQSSKNKELIEKYQKQLLILKKAIPEEEFSRATEVSEEITRRALERRQYPFTSSGLATDRYARSKTYTSGAPISKEEKIAKAKAEIERLKKEWKTIPPWETEAKSKLKKEAKKFADYIERLEGTVKPTVAKSVDTPKSVKPVDSTSAALKPINSFRGENAFLSNMSESSFKVGQDSYPTVEHFFQAMKTTDKAERAKILAAKTPAEAKKIGKTVTLRKNWNQIREEVMETGLRAKFMQNPELKKKLLETKDADLIEGNTWGDTFWGQVDGKGQNKLGKLLMKIRDELMKGK